MKNKVCIKCGSTSFISDRSLGGRIVCKKCGSSSIKNSFRPEISSRRLFYIFLFILVILVIII